MPTPAPVSLGLWSPDLIGPCVFDGSPSIARIALASGCWVFNPQTPQGQDDPAHCQVQNLYWQHAEDMTELGPTMLIIDTDTDTGEVTQF